MSVLDWLSLDEHVAILHFLRPQPKKRNRFKHRFDDTHSADQEAHEYVARWRGFHAAALACRPLAVAAATILEQLRNEVMRRNISGLHYTTAFMNGRLHWGRIHFALADADLHLSDAGGPQAVGAELVQPGPLPPSTLSDEWRLLASTTHSVCSRYRDLLRYEERRWSEWPLPSDAAHGMAELLLLWCLHFDRGGRSLTVTHIPRFKPWAEEHLPYYIQELNVIDEDGTPKTRLEPFDSLNLLVRELAIATPAIWGGFEVFWLTRGSPWLWPADRLDDDPPHAGWVLEGYSHRYCPTQAELVAKHAGERATYKSAMLIEFAALRELINEGPLSSFEGPHVRGRVYETFGERGALHVDASMQLVRALVRMDVDEAQQVMHYFLETDGAMPRPSQPTDDYQYRLKMQLAMCSAMLACVLEAEDRLDDAARVLRYARDMTGRWDVLESSYLTERLYRMWQATTLSPCERGTAAALERAELLQRFPILGAARDADVPPSGPKSAGLPSIRPPWLLAGSLDRFFRGGRRYQPRPLQPVLALKFLLFDEDAVKVREGSAAYYAHLTGPFLDVSMDEASARGGDLTRSSHPPEDLDDAIERWWRAGLHDVHHFLRGVRREANGEFSYHVMTQVLQPCDIHNHPFNAEGDEARRELHTYQTERRANMTMPSYNYGAVASPRRDDGMKDALSFNVVSEHSTWVSISRLNAWKPTSPPDYADVRISLRWPARWDARWAAGGWQEGTLCEVCCDTMMVAMGQCPDETVDDIRLLLEIFNKVRANEANSAAKRALAESHAAAARDRVMAAASRAAEAAWNAAIAATASSNGSTIAAAGKAQDAATRVAVALFKPLVTHHAAQSDRQLALKAAKASSIAHTAAMEPSRIDSTAQVSHVGYGRFDDDEAWQRACLTTREACTAVNMKWPLCEWKISRKEASRLMCEFELY